jgi:hypothetical protein
MRKGTMQDAREICADGTYFPNNLCIYIYIYVCVCVCVCVFGGGVYLKIQKSFDLAELILELNFPSLYEYCLVGILPVRIHFSNICSRTNV